MKGINHVMKRFGLLVLFVLVGAVPTFAQTATTATNLTVALTDTSSRTVQLAAATGVEAGGRLFVDQEAMDVVSVNSTTVQVTRGTHGTPAQQHAVSALVYVASRSQIASVFTGERKSVVCTSTSEAFLPQIDEAKGDIWFCNGGVWTAINWNRVSYNVGRTAVAGTANYTILPTDYLIGITTITAARTFTLPAPTLTQGKSFIIVDESGAVSTSNTVTVSGLFNTVGNGIAINVAFGSVRIYSNGSRYFQF